MKMLLLCGRQGATRLAVASLALGPSLPVRPAAAGDFSIKPVLTAAVAYDSNVFVETLDPTADYFGSVSLLVPVDYKIGRHSGVGARYHGSSEWYRDLTELNKFPTRQVASLDYRYQSGRGLTLGFGGSYSESQRPEDVFPESGAEFGRSRARNAGGSAFVGRKLGRRGDLGLTYGYGTSLYLADERADSHTGTATLGRELGPRAHLDVRYSIHHYGFPRTDGRDTSQAATAGWSQKISRRTLLTLRAGGRFVGDTVKPEFDASLSHQWRRSGLALSYGRTRSFVPTNDLFADVQRASLAFTLRTRSFSFSLSPSYYRSRAETRVFETYRGSADSVYMIARWLGLGASYAYTYQRPLEPAGGNTRRHLAHLGVVVAPWSGREPQPLR